MLDTLITSKTRIKLLLKFFLNPDISAYLRGLSKEFGESSNAVRLELNRLEGAGMLSTQNEGNKKIFKVNQSHPLYDDVKRIVLKFIGIDQIINNVVKGLGELEELYLVGDLAEGKQSEIIDLIFIGNINRQYLNETIIKTEQLISKKIKYLIFDSNETVNLPEDDECILLWEKTPLGH